MMLFITVIGEKCRQAIAAIQGQSQQFSVFMGLQLVFLLLGATYQAGYKKGQKNKMVWNIEKSLTHA